MPVPAGSPGWKLLRAGTGTVWSTTASLEPGKVAGIQWTPNNYLLNEQTWDVSRVTKNQQGQRLIEVHHSWECRSVKTLAAQDTGNHWRQGATCWDPGMGISQNSVPSSLQDLGYKEVHSKCNYSLQQIRQVCTPAGTPHSTSRWNRSNGTE